MDVQGVLIFWEDMKAKDPPPAPPTDEPEIRQRISELELLLADERERRRLAETFNQINTTLNSSLNAEDVLDCILEHVSRLVPHDSVLYAG